MIFFLWNLLRGYVTIAVSGFSVERFMNLAAGNDIFLWDVVRRGDRVEMKVGVKGFFLLGPYIKKTKCRVRVVGRSGLPFAMKRYKKRKVFAVSAVFFVFSLLVLASFIWKIDISGAKRIDKAQLLAYLSEIGIARGAWKPGINDKKAELALSARFPDIAWVDVYVKGTRVVVSLAETIQKKEIIDTSTPRDLVAKADGLIESVAVSAGTPKVRQGDVVRKGELLVASEIQVGTEDSGYTKKYVRANAVVMAKMYYEIELFIPFSYNSKSYTGNVAAEYSIMLFDRVFTPIKAKVPFESFDIEDSAATLGFGDDYPLPFAFSSRKYREFVNAGKTRDIDGAKQRAAIELTGRIIAELPPLAEIIEKRVEYQANEERLYVKAFLTTIEEIQESKAIEENMDIRENTGESAE